ncbi:immunoglobulin A1 protease [Streptococcus pneumoniae]|nr:YSIRK-type signal peptide-containing protein [Streptococcus pneumoniae]CEX23756.1 immunoglobulin A1 protease [Streptococcus pneumoniae]CIR45963.1 immunoglobulin A1 protease [Streptococcus pneumoniae]CIV72935.1 immunoglobulin A1 protease [Streptococcus pneumoniae]CKE80418.1 immunoglobulin A1 protease [Streptococcus pneumoniae]CKF19901.1 immunoglobulin A1 protease [Streptococcus pneumoniae]
MEKYFGEKQERFSFRKLSVGLVSATISSLFFRLFVNCSGLKSAKLEKGQNSSFLF